MNSKEVQTELMRQHWPAVLYISKKLYLRYRRARPGLDRDDWTGISVDVLLACIRKYDPARAKFITYYINSCWLRARLYLTGSRKEVEETNLEVNPTVDIDYYELFELDDFREYQKYLTRRQWGIMYDRCVRGYTLRECAEVRGVSYQYVQQTFVEIVDKLKRRKAIGR